MCDNRTLTGNAVYVWSPGYPFGIAGSGSCLCQATGTEMQVTILQLTADPVVDYVLNTVINNMQQQINAVELFFQIASENASSVDIELAYAKKNNNSLSRFWWRLNSEAGKNLIVVYNYTHFLFL